MKKLQCSALAFFLGILQLFAQKQPTKPDTSTYEVKPLSFKEANLVSSYYGQNGNHSAVTGGIGSEKLSDYGNTIDLKFSGQASSGKVHTFGLEMGIDHYTSASSDKIDPRERKKGGHGGGGGGVVDSVTLMATGLRTSASYSDTRYYPSLSWSVEDKPKHEDYGATLSFSKEYDYFSIGASGFYSKRSRNGNRELSMRAGAFFDSWMLIYPIELAPQGYDNEEGDYVPRQSFDVNLSYSQVLTRRLQLSVLADVAYQNGQLATNYQRVFFDDGSVHVETLPGNRLKFPVAMRANYFLGEKVILRSLYRFYNDDWGVRAHSFNFEPVFKRSAFSSVSPFYRLHIQRQADYFAAYREHTAADAYFTSDYDLSSFTSHFFGIGLRNAPPKAELIPFFGGIELRAGAYLRSDGLQAGIVTLALTFK